MRERQRLGQIFIEPQAPGQRARNLRDLERMGKPCAIVIALVKNENLGLVLETAECGGVDDTVAIAAKGAAAGAGWLGVKPAAACFRVAGIGRTGNGHIYWSIPRRPSNWPSVPPHLTIVLAVLQSDRLDSESR